MHINTGGLFDYGGKKATRNPNVRFLCCYDCLIVSEPIRRSGLPDQNKQLQIDHLSWIHPVNANASWSVNTLKFHRALRAHTHTHTFDLIQCVRNLRGPFTAQTTTPQNAKYGPIIIFYPNMFMDRDFYIDAIFDVWFERISHVFCSLMPTCDVHVHGNGNCIVGLHDDALTVQKNCKK